MLRECINSVLSQTGKLWTIRILAVVAVAISSYLAYVTFSNTGPAGCGDGASSLGCDEVLTTRWSSWLGVPVSVFAVLTYLLILGFSFRATGNQTSRAIFCALGFTAGLAALWFMFLQTFVLEKFCPYCIAVHVCGLTIAGLIISCGNFQLEESDDSGSYPWLAQPIVAAVLGMIVLVGGQYAYAPPEILISDLSDEGARQGSIQAVETPNGHSRNIAPTMETGEPAALDSNVPESNQSSNDATDNVGGSDDGQTSQQPPSPDSVTTDAGSGNATNATPDTAAAENASELEAAGDKPEIKKPDRFERVGPMSVNVTNSILIGDQDVEEIIVEMVDYSCPKCRKAHQQLEKFKKVAKEPFSTLLLLVPLNASCNPHIRMTHPMNAQSCNYTKLAMVLWDLKPEAFPDFHSWMMQGDVPPDINSAMSYVAKILPDTNLNEQLNRQDLPGKISLNAEIYFRTGSGKLPRFYINEHSIAGVPSDDRQMFSAFQSLLAKQ